MKYTPQEYTQLLKVLYNLSLEEFYEAMGREPETDHGEYILTKFFDLRHNLFNFLCSLDETNITNLFLYADKKTKG